MKAATPSTAAYLAERGMPTTVQWGLITDLQSRAGSEHEGALAMFADWNAVEILPTTMSSARAVCAGRRKPGTSTKRTYAID